MASVRRIRFFLCAVLALVGAAAAPASAEAGAAPAGFSPAMVPSDRSAHVLFNRWLTVPSWGSRVGAAGAIALYGNLSLSQNLINGYYPPAVSGGPRRLVSFIDYEVLSGELLAAVGLGEGWQLGLGWQAAWYYGGFLDRPIHEFHSLFDFPDNARGQLPMDRFLIDLPTKAPGPLLRTEPVFALADPVFMVGGSLIDLPDFALAGRGLLAIPLGLGQGLNGCEYPQAGIAAEAEWLPLPWLGLALRVGGSFPLAAWADAGPLPGFQAGLFAAFRLDAVAPYLQLRFASSQMRGTFIVDGEDWFARPNADLTVGLLVIPPGAERRGGYVGLAVQEDPFSFNASDVGFTLHGAAAF